MFAARFVRTVMVSLLVLSAGCAPSAESWLLTSPEGAIEVRLEWVNRGGEADYPEGARLYYTVSRDGMEILMPSPLGITTDRADYTHDLAFVGMQMMRVEDNYRMLSGKSSQRSVTAHEYVFDFLNATGDAFSVVFRLQADGVAYRYVIAGTGEVVVQSEASGFRVPDASAAFMAPFDTVPGLFSGVYEQSPRPISLGASTIGSGWAYPALFETPGGWAMITEAHLDGTYCGTRLGPNPQANVYRVTLAHPADGQGLGEALPRTMLPLTTPWRTIIAGSIADIVQSTLVDDLSPETELTDTSWIRSGRSAWSWFTQYTGGPSLQREYIDFASAMGWEYVLVDEGWDRWSDLEDTMVSLIAYATERNVRLLLWYNSGGEHTVNEGTPRDLLIESETRLREFARLQAWGVAGIKVDFFESDKQDRMQQYLGILEDAATHELLVNFHGATLPRGWQRTYPHLMTYEAVRGVEYNMFVPNPPGAAEHLMYIFTRNVVGSMDYTPVVFVDPLRNASVTYAQSLAQAVLFESGLQHYADRADAAEDEGYRAIIARFPEVCQVLSEVPAAWDETLLLSGDPRTHAVLARRTGRRWYVAGMSNGEEAVEIDVALPFVTEAMSMTLVRRDDAEDSLRSEQRDVMPNARMSLRLGAHDGFVAWFDATPRSPAFTCGLANPPEGG